MKHLQEYRDGQLSRKILDRIREISRKPIRLMEVCGTHTVSIFRNGIRSVLPDTISLISGPGCPVCVTAQNEIDACIALAREPETIVATFGDLIRVPGSGSSLQKEQANGADIRIVYSALDAVSIAEQNLDKTVVFLGVGFETTAPTVAASILSAKEAGVANYTVYCAHKVVPPALEALMSPGNLGIDGFLLPGHVSVIIGSDAYADFFRKYHIPCVIAGFEPTDLLQSILRLAEMIETGAPALENGYPRAVTAQGNRRAREIMNTVYEPCDAEWRGLGPITGSGLCISKEFESFDAVKRFGIVLPEAKPIKGCACGDILTGRMTPPECPLYKKVCTPIDPVGPCMVSSEGTCAAYFKYHSE